MRNLKPIILTLFTALLLKCGIYSYTSGAYEIPTISVSRIKNNIKTHSPTIDYKITEKLEEKLNQQEDLELTEKDGYLQMIDSIIDYNIKPISVGRNYEPGINRVTIILSLSLLNQIDNDKVTTKTIVAFVDYDANLNFGQVKDSLNTLLSTKLADEIYNEFFIRW